MQRLCRRRQARASPAGCWPCLLYTSREMRERYGDEFEAAMGAEAVQDLLKEIDLDQLSAELTAEVEKSSGQKKVRILKRLEVVEAFRVSGNRPEWMVCLLYTSQRY